ncbi:MAG: hypothetical protein ACM359_12080 [Bacillota bacterium]
MTWRLEVLNMLNMVKWALSAAVAVGLLVGWSATSVRAADEAAKVTIKGKVLNKEGKPAEGVKVNLYKSGSQQRPAAGQQRQRPEALATATTDKEGKFEIATDAKKVPDGTYRVSSGSRDTGFGMARVTIKGGKVVDKDGKPTEVTIKYGEMPSRRGGAGGGNAGGNR